jgi:hypothetical protein
MNKLRTLLKSNGLGVVKLFGLLIAVLILPVPATAAGCPTDGACYGEPAGAATCQFCYTTSGDVYGSHTVKDQTVSAGTRLNNKLTNILYNTYPKSNLCRFVDNNTGSDLFVPQGSVAEFESFVLHAPTGITFSDCTFDAPYNGTASLPNGFWITANGGPENDPSPSTYQTGTQDFNLPVTRVGNSSQPNSFTLPPYTRYDCTLGTTPDSGLCLARTIVETQQITLKTIANPNPACATGTAGVGTSCDGTWDKGTINTYSCTVDGVPYGSGPSSCLAGYDGKVNGTCGSSPSTCLYGTVADSFDDGTRTVWACMGVGVGSRSSNCSSSDSGPVNGACSISANSCAPGTPYNMADDGTTSTWTCAGLNGGADSPPCSSPDADTPAVCGSSVGTCTSGTVGGFNPSAPLGTTEWTCDSPLGSNDAICDSVNGICDNTSAGGCTSGTTTNMSSNGFGSTWTCQGSGGGISDNTCNYYLQPVCDEGGGDCGGCLLGSSFGLTFSLCGITGQCLNDYFCTTDNNVSGAYTMACECWGGWSAP